VPEDYEASSDAERDGANSIMFWSAGTPDISEADVTVAPIRALGFGIGASDIINDALALPMFVDDTDVPSSFVEDTGSKAAYGVKSVSFPDLIVLSGPAGETAVHHTKMIATYYVDNYKDPRERIRRLEFVSNDPDVFSGPAMWAFLCGVDISDVITVTTNHPGGGGFAADYFVERIETSAAPGSDGFDIVTMSLDVSPRAFYDTDPFS
jgi:hypothetical protein